MDDDTHNETPQNFENFVKKKHNSILDDLEGDRFAQRQRSLHKRLKNIRLGSEPKPLTGRHTLSSEGIGAIGNSVAEQDNKHGLSHHQGQDTYKKKTIRFKDLIAEQTQDERFETSV